MIISCNDDSQYLQVLQRNCVISKNYTIVTGSFGPCYILMGYDSNTKYTFLAHIDDSTQCEDIPLIFKKLKELSVKIENLSLNLMGGWKEHPESNLWEKKIIEQLKNIGVYEKTDLTYLFKKEKRPDNRPPKNTAEKYYFFGVLIDPKSGKFQFFKKPWKKLHPNERISKQKFEKNQNNRNKKITEKVDQILSEKQITLPATLDIDGTNVKILKNGNEIRFEIPAEIYPLKISLI